MQLLSVYIIFYHNIVSKGSGGHVPSIPPWNSIPAHASA